jgi:hypothetical protein
MQSSCPGSRDLNRSGKGLKSMEQSTVCKWQIVAGSKTVLESVYSIWNLWDTAKYVVEAEKL